MSEAVLVALISALSLISVALITVIVPLLISTLRHARTGAVSASLASEQLVNNHTTNLREEADQRHDQVMSMFNSLSTWLMSIDRRLSDVEEDKRFTPGL